MREISMSIDTIRREDLQHILQKVRYAVITPHGRAASMFLQGLFDRHQEVAVLPLMIDVYDFYTNDKESFSPEEYIEFFDKNNPGLFDLKNCIYLSSYAEDPGEEVKNVNRSKFCKIFFTLCNLYGPCHRKEYFSLLHIAFFLMCGKHIENLKLILVHLHNYDTIVTTKTEKIAHSFVQHKRFFMDLPDAKFIAPIRDPLQSTESFLSLANVYELQASSTNRIYYQMHTWSCLYNMQKIVKDIFFFDLPELHKNFDSTMKNLCSFLYVQYDPSLKEATFFGNPWVGRSGKQKHSSSLGENFVAFSGNILTQEECAVVRFFFHDVFVRFFSNNAELCFADVMLAAKWYLYSVLKIQSMNDAYLLKGIFKEYFRLKRFRFLDNPLISNASYQSTNS